MDGRDDHGSLAHRRRDSFDRPGTDVANGEQPGHGGREAIAGDDEPLRDKLGTHVVQSLRAGVCADHQEKIAQQ